VCSRSATVERSRATGVDERWILIADADRESASRLHNHFSRSGLRAYQTTRGQEAMLLANSRQIRLAIIDTALADMDGTALAVRLKAIEPELPVVMTSGDHRPETEAEARRIGIVFFAHKPAPDHLIGGVVEKALEA
jgi:DNA-binding NtrC family response regulator